MFSIEKNKELIILIIIFNLICLAYYSDIKLKPLEQFEDMLELQKNDSEELEKLIINEQVRQNMIAFLETNEVKSFFYMVQNIEEYNLNKCKVLLKVTLEYRKKSGFVNNSFSFFSTFILCKKNNQYYIEETDFFQELNSSNKLFILLMVHVFIVVPVIGHILVYQKRKKLFWCFVVLSCSVLGILLYLRHIRKNK